MFQLQHIFPGLFLLFLYDSLPPLHHYTFYRDPTKSKYQTFIFNPLMNIFGWKNTRVRDQCLQKFFVNITAIFESKTVEIYSKQG